MFNDKRINTQNAELDEITLGQSSPDILSGPGIHSCLIPAKTCSVHTKQLCYRNIYGYSNPSKYTIRPTLTFLESNQFLPCHSSPEPSEYRGHSWAGSDYRLQQQFALAWALFEH